MKKMKFRKLSRVLISISLLAIIAVSLISVPVSAAIQDDIIGEWTFDLTDMDGFVPSSFRTFTAEGYFYSYNPENSSFEKTDLVTVMLEWSMANGYLHLTDYSPDGRYHSVQLAFLKRTDEWIWECTYDDNGTDRYIRSTDVSEEDKLKVCTFEIESISGTYLNELYDFLSDHATKVIPPEPTLLENILGTFSEVGSWIGTIISSLVALFWSVETASLTFLGILSVAGLAFSVIMLLFGIVTRFVGFSG